jgi:hypothetical protein
MKRLARVLRILDEVLECVLVLSWRRRCGVLMALMVAYVSLTAFRIHQVTKELYRDGYEYAPIYRKATIASRPPTRADLAIEALVVEFKRARSQLMMREPHFKAGSIWGVGTDLPGRTLAPSRALAEEQLILTEPLRAVLLSRMDPRLEAPGEHCLLARDHDYHYIRSLVNLLTNDALSLLLAGRYGEAMEVIARTLAVARIVSRGLAGSPTLLPRLVGLASVGTVDSYVALALQRHLVPEWYLDVLDDIYATAQRRELRPDPAVAAEFERLFKLGHLVDERMGITRYLDWFLFGSYETQIQRMRDRWMVGDALRPAGANGKTQPEGPQVRWFFQAIEENVTHSVQSLQVRGSIRRSLRQGIRAAISLERTRYQTGAYPLAAPSEFPDPHTGRPYIFRQEGNFWLLYGLGLNRTDDNATRFEDAVVWGRNN